MFRSAAEAVPFTQLLVGVMEPSVSGHRTWTSRGAMLPLLLISGCGLEPCWLVSVDICDDASLLRSTPAISCNYLITDCQLIIGWGIEKSAGLSRGVK